jgi:GntR family transcriptional repressor for pyruvate dehydrogenase complex
MFSPPERMGEVGTIFTPAKRTRSFEDVVEQIRDAVIEGKLKNGERLPNERELCRLFGISRSTLREGLRALEALGVVEVRTGAAGGVFVSEPGGDQLGLALEALIRFSDATARDLAEFRVSFEGETAYWAAERATTEDVVALERIVEEFALLASEEDVPWPTLAELDVKFHDAVAHASHNQVRAAIMLGIHRALFRASTSIGPLMDAAQRRSIARELAGIRNAVVAGDTRTARSRMRRHVKKFADLERIVQDQGVGGAHAWSESKK